jgi:hypothetical protein
MPGLEKTLSFALVGVFAFLALTPPAHAQDLRFSVTPYIWLPTVDGDLNFDPPPGFAGSPGIEVGPVDYLENLQGVFMIAGEARYGRFGAVTDFIYLDFANEDANVRTVTGPGPLEIPIDVGSQFDLSGTLWTIAGGYDVIDNGDVRVQVFAGARNLNAEATVNWALQGPLNQFPQSGQLNDDVNVWDGLIGVRGAAVSGNWVFPYYVDVGTGSSDLTWQASAGVGYRFGWGDLTAYYRGLHYEQGDSELIENLDLSGPAIGATFRF